jgi:Spx/MgsR family transcriptional regulator
MYGIPNCNTIKKARAWLEERAIDYQFHDYKKAGTDPEQLRAWVDEFGWDKIVNTRGMTWRKLDDNTKTSMNAAGAVQLMMDKPSIIKRPLLVVGDQRILGFDEAAYAAAFDQA